MVGLTTDQVDALLQPLDRGRVKQKQGQSHLEAWDDRRHLLRVFGWGGFDIETLECTCILERSVWESEKATETHKGRHTVAYRVQARLIVKDVEGNELCHFDDGAVGDSQNQPGFAAAHDMALKTAFSQALKRCCVNLGDRFGLSLYNKGTTGAVVGKSLAHSATTEHAAVEEVTGGELDAGEGEESGPTPSPVETEAPTASADEHQILRTALEHLDDEDKAVVKAWWADKGLPSIKDSDVLTAPEVAAAFDFLDKRHEERRSRADRARQIAEDNGLPIPDELQGPAKARAALNGGRP